MTTGIDVVASTGEHVDTAVRDAAGAASAILALSPTERATAMETVADALAADGEKLSALAVAESHLPDARIAGELARTVFQFRFLADRVRAGAFLDATIDLPDAAWPPGPRPDLRRVLRPVGPVLVFEASNFPLAFGAAGTDTASAMAAGCPIVLKAHPAHPELTARTTQVLQQALADVGLPAGGFGTVYGEDAGRQALLHPSIKAASFTGSLPGGRALFDLACSRANPIPFYAEMGSVNPVFLTQAAIDERGEAIWAEFVSSFATHAGQLCTKPGILVAPHGSIPVAALRNALASVPAIEMLSPRIRSGFEHGLAVLRDAVGVHEIAIDNPAHGAILTVAITDVFDDPEAVLHEVFGPACVIITYDDPRQVLTLAQVLDGQLTATVHAAAGEPIGELVDTLAERAGRVILNGWPTGVSVTDAMQHGGPYPATTSTYTSVGSGAVTRFLRPVAYQGVPDALLPPSLRDSNPWKIHQQVNGRPTIEGAYDDE